MVCIVLQIKNWDAEELHGLFYFPQLTSSKKEVQTPGLSDFKTCALIYYTTESAGYSNIHIPAHPLFLQVSWESAPIKSLVLSVLSRREHAAHQEEETWWEGRAQDLGHTDLSWILALPLSRYVILDKYTAPIDSTSIYWAPIMFQEIF